MKKRLIPIALVLGAISANAQVGIGTATPNKSAELTVHAKDGNRGVLIPNVSLSDTKDKGTIKPGNVNSLLVFNINTAKDVTPGYYYWYVDKWERLTTANDIPAIVVNNFENILNMDGDKVTNLIENIVRNTEGNVIYEGDKLYYIDNGGNKVEINFDDIVKQYETVTVLGYDAVTGALTYSNEEGVVVTVDIKQAVKSFETVTSIALDDVAGTISFIDEAGATTTLNLSAFIKQHETVTNLVRVQPGKYTYTNEEGTIQNINVIGDITEVIQNKTDLDLYNVLKQLVKLEQSLTSLIYNATTKELVYTDEANTPHNIDVEALVKDNQFVTELQQGTNIQVVQTTNGNTISYTLNVPTATRDVAGVVKPGSGLDIDADGNLSVNLETAVNAKDLTGNEKIVVTDGKGAVLKTTSLDINEAKLSLQNIGGTLNLTQLQAGNAGDVLIVDADGNVVWSAKDAMTTNELTLVGTDLTSTVNGVSSTVSLVDKLTTEMFQNGSVTAEKLNGGAGADGRVGVAGADGTITYQTLDSVVKSNESQTVIITVDDKQYYVSEAYLVANKGVVPTTVDATNLPAGIYAIDVVGGVVNNFEEIINSGPIMVDGSEYNTINDYITHVTQTGGFTKIVYDQTTGDVIFQEWNATENKWVNVDNSKFETIVQSNESKTTIITVNDKQYYVSETYLQANDGVVPTTVDATNLPAGIYEIDVVGGVVNNFEEIVNNGPITVDGDTYQTINDYITHLTETTGGFTKIVYDQTTGDVIFQEWDESTNSWVNVDNSKFETIVQANESQTTIITVDDKQYYVSEAYLAANDGVVPTTVDPAKLPAGIYAIDVVGGVVNNFEEIVNNGPITVDGDTYQTINDYITHLTETTGGFTKIVYDQTTGDAIFQEWDESTNSWVNVDNSKFETIVKANETVTVLVENKNGTFTYYNEKEIDANGQPKAGATGVTLDPALVIVEDLSKTEGKYIFKDSEGNPIATIDINSDNIRYDNSDSGLTSTNVKDALDELANTIATTKGDLSLAGGLEFTGGTDGAAKLLANAGIQIADGGVSTDKIADKAVTAGKLDAGKVTSDAPRVGIADQEGNVTYQELQTVVQAEQKTVVLEDGINTKVSSRVDTANPNETIWKVDVANAVKTVATATALVADDAVVLVNADNAPTEGIVITLPTADATNKGKKYTIKKLDTNEDGYVVVEGNVAGLNGKKLETGLPYSGWDFVSDGTQWQIVNKF